MWRRALIIACASSALVMLMLGRVWLLDAASDPAPADARAITNVERAAWPGITDQINSIILVQRGSYAAVVTNIDFDNYALFHKTTAGWVRMTRNGWLFRPDKFAFSRAGVPFPIANALVNGLRSKMGKGLDLFSDDEC